MCRRTTSTLQMTKNRDTHIIAREFFLYTICIIKSTALRAFRDNNDTRTLRLTYTTFHKLCQLVDIRTILRNNSRFCSTGYSTVLCQEPSITSHDFNEEYTLMALSCITNTVYTFYNSIHSSIITYC